MSSTCYLLEFLVPGKRAPLPGDPGHVIVSGFGLFSENSPTTELSGIWVQVWRTTQSGHNKELVMERVPITGMQVPQFDVTDISDGDGIMDPWFEASMVSACQPLFDGCGSNHEVEDKLKAAGVITKEGMQTDTESCALVVNFSTVEVIEPFISRLNAYLIEKAKKIAEAAAF